MFDRPFLWIGAAIGAVITLLLMLLMQFGLSERMVVLLGLGFVLIVGVVLLDPWSDP